LDDTDFSSARLPSMSPRNRTTLASTEELRMVEAEDVLETLRGNELTGLGLGSTFTLSLEDLKEDAQGLAPHIGILTHLLKGGIVVFLAVGLLPALLALNRFFLPKRNDAISLSIWGGVLVFFVSSCISGGYSQAAMFVYGILISMGLRWDRFNAAKLKLAKANISLYNP
jgi:hypothetical protein